VLVRQNKINKIDGFTGYFDFLRPDYTGENVQVQLDGQFYNSVSQAYHIARTKMSFDQGNN